MLKRGIRVLPGGDYGFAWAPHGENAKDLEYFVKYLGMTPMETLISATRWGGQMMMKKDLGEIREGWLADLLLVDGDPLSNISVLQDKQKILAVMKDGEFYKSPEIRSARTRFAACGDPGASSGRWRSACRSWRSSPGRCGTTRASSPSRS